MPGGADALRTALRLAIVIAVVTALIVVATTSRWGLWWRLITFTYQANLLAAGYYLWTMVSPRADSRVGVRGAVVLYVVMAGLIWNLFLTGHSMGYTVANFLLHVVVPLLALTDWLLVGQAPARVLWWQPLAWLVYPAAYLTLALLVLNTAGRRAPYFFLDPATVGPATVALNVSVLAAAVLALGYGLMAVNRAAVTARPDVL
ncbi:MAG: Pr6Pr family membrane protein [Actinomycetota bacterium]|nr:Pr6Pr family membrane protein [Actinomycetota bacterium]